MADGKLKEIESIHEIGSGNIIREKGKSVAPFSDCVILQITKRENSICPGYWVKFSRPYAFVSGAGTTSPTVLLGAETIECDFERLKKLYVQVLTERDCSHDFVT
jgi:hypothetical protein